MSDTAAATHITTAAATATVAATATATAPAAAATAAAATTAAAAAATTTTTTLWLTGVAMRLGNLFLRGSNRVAVGCCGVLKGVCYDS